jgi:hypothetical protein
MAIFKHASAVGLLAVLSAGWAVAADEPGSPGAEHRAQMRQWCKDNPEKCREAMHQKAEAWWKRVDTDSDGAVSRAEADANAPRLASEFDRVDADGDGKVTREELKPPGKGAPRSRKDWWRTVERLRRQHQPGGSQKPTPRGSPGLHTARHQRGREGHARAEGGAQALTR